VVINVEKLKKAGVSVRIFERNGKKVDTEVKHLQDVFIEVFFESGRMLSEQVTSEIRGMLPDEYGEAVLEGLHDRIHSIQIMEAINKTAKVHK
jgi:hypothetical protein